MKRQQPAAGSGRLIHRKQLAERLLASGVPLHAVEAYLDELERREKRAKKGAPAPCPERSPGRRGLVME